MTRNCGFDGEVKYVFDISFLYTLFWFDKTIYVSSFES